jgi:hypothetical protein
MTLQKVKKRVKEEKSNDSECPALAKLTVDLYREAIAGVAKPLKLLTSRSSTQTKTEAESGHRSKYKTADPIVSKRSKSSRPKEEPLFLTDSPTPYDYIDDEAIESDEEGDNESENDEDRAFIDDSYEGTRKRKSRNHRSRDKRVKRDKTRERSPTPTKDSEPESPLPNVKSRNVSLATKKEEVDVKPIDLASVSSDDFDGIEEVEDELPAFKRSDDEQKRPIPQPQRPRRRGQNSHEAEQSHLNDEEPPFPMLSEEGQGGELQTGWGDDDVAMEDFFIHDEPMPAGAQYSTLATPAGTLQQDKYDSQQDEQRSRPGSHPRHDQYAVSHHDNQILSRSITPEAGFSLSSGPINDYGPIDSNYQHAGAPFEKPARQPAREARQISQDPVERDADDFDSDYEDMFDVMKYARPQLHTLPRLPSPQIVPTQSQAAPAPLYPPQYDDQRCEYESDGYDSRSDVGNDQYDHGHQVSRAGYQDRK